MKHRIPFPGWDTGSLNKAAKDIKNTLEEGLNSVQTDALDDAKSVAEDLCDTLTKASNALDGKKLSQNTQTFKSGLDKLVNSTNNVLDKMYELENLKIPTKGYEEISDRATELRAELQATENAMVRLNTAGKGNTEAFYEASVAAKKLRSHLQVCEETMREMRDKGLAYTLGKDTEEYQKQAKTLEDLTSRMTIMRSRIEDQNVAWLKSTTGFKAFSTVTGVLGNDIKKLLGHVKNLAKNLATMVGRGIINGVKRLGSAFANLTGHVKNSNMSMGGLLKTFILGGLGVHGITAAIGKLRSGIAAGLENLASMNNGVNNVRATLNEFTTSLDYLKNSLAAAFYPIIQVVQPILTGFIDRIAQTIQKIGALVSALAGMSSYMKVTRTPSKSKAEQTADKAAARAQTKSDKAAARSQYNAEKAAYKQQVKDEKAAVKEQNKQRKEIEKANKQIGKNTTKTNNNTRSKNNNTKATTKNANALKKQQNVLAGFDDLDVLGKEEDNDTVLDSLNQPMQAVPPEAAANIKDFDGALQDVAETLPEVAEAFEEADIPGWIQNIADKIKEFIANGDWYGLGQYIGEGFNKVLGMVNDWINNVLRPEGIKWAARLAQFLNGLVDSINWPFLGQTIANGLNAIMQIIYTFLTTFDFLNLGEKLGAGILSLFQNINWELAGRTFAAGWNALFHTIEGIVTTPGIWSTIGNSIGTFLKAAIDEIDIDSLITSFIAIFNGIFEMLRAFLDANPFEGLAEKIYNALNRLIHEINWAEAGKTLSDFVIALLNVFFEVAENTDWEGFGQAIGDFLSNINWSEILGKAAAIIWKVVSGIIKGFLGTDSGKAFLAIVAGIEGLKLAFALGAKLLLPAVEKVLIEKLAQLLVTKGFGGIFSACVSAVSTSFSTIIGLISSMGSTLLAGISSLLSTIMGVVQGFLAVLFTPQGLIVAAIAAALTLLFVLIYNNWETIVEFLGKCGEWLGKAWKWVVNGFVEMGKGIVQTLKDTVNAGIQMVENFVNGIITGINFAIMAINALSFDVPDWVPIIGGNHVGFNIPYINTITLPKLAEGAVIPPNKQFLAMLGDQKSGTNIEAPLDTIVDAFRQVVGNMQVQNTGYSEMVLDGQTFARLATPYIVSELGRRGYDVDVLEG